MEMFRVYVEGFYPHITMALSAENAVWNICGRAEFYNRFKKGKQIYVSTRDQIDNVSDFELQVCDAGVKITETDENEDQYCF